MAHVTQEDFVSVSGRTYVSTLERGLKSPTLNKVDELSTVMGVHPLALLTLTYCDQISVEEVRRLLKSVERDLDRFILAGPQSR